MICCLAYMPSTGRWSWNCSILVLDSAPRILYCIITFFGLNLFSENATMSDWSPFTTCSASCGGGRKIRYRTCNTSRSEGKDCFALGPLTEQQPCNIHDCNGELLLTLVYFEIVRNAIYGYRSHPFSNFPDFSLVKAKFPWPKKCKMSGLVVTCSSTHSLRMLIFNKFSFFIKEQYR